MEKNRELELAWDFVEHTGRSIFLTGKAGTGKTTFLRAVRENSKKRMIVVAPTGVAAINAQGVTIHSFFQLPPSVFLPETQLKRRYDFSKEKRNILRTLDLLIIDEISMVRSDLLDAIDTVLRRYRVHNQPFGGVQLLMIGDLQQLTPVVTPEEEQLLKGHYSTPYFFGSRALQAINYVTIELTHVYRQQDDTFINILNHIREGKTTADDLKVLNSRCQPDFHPSAEEDYIRLTTHNRMAENYNNSELNRLLGAEQIFDCEINDNFPEYLYPTQPRLVLKTGAQVMFVKNDSSADHRYYNGKIGHITHMNNEMIYVLCPGDEQEIEVRREQWDNTKYTLDAATKMIVPEVQGSFIQFPLRLAWAITIHKSQGLTFEHAIIDAQLSFASGQVYVALSRCKTLEGMILASPIPQSAILKDQRVDEYISHQEEEAKKSISILPQLKQEYERYQLLELFNFWELKTMEEGLYRTLAEYFQSFPKILQLHRISQKDFTVKVIGTASKWASIIAGMTYEQLHDEEFLERVKRSAVYFHDELNRIFGTLVDVTKGASNNNKTAMKRLDNAYTDVAQTYLAKKYLLEDIAQEGFTTANYLKYKSEAYLVAVDGQSRKTSSRSRKSGSQTKAPKIDTHTITMNLFNQGKSVQEIAKERGLAEGTIFGHLSDKVLEGELEVSSLIPVGKQAQIQAAIIRLGDQIETLTDIKEILPDEITFSEIRLVRMLMNKDKEKKA